MLPELRLETHHVGRVLFVRTFCEPRRMQSIGNAIEDQDFNVDMPQTYNGDPKIDAVHVLPKNTISAIKGPFYKTGSSGGYLVRVDRPSDLVKVAPTHESVPAGLAPRRVELDEDALKYKNIGNAAFKKKDYLPALEAYTQGLDACGDDDELLKCDLYRNRSIINIHLYRYEQAAADATSAFIPDAASDETKMRNNVKALFRAGRAYHCSENFSEARSHFQQLLQLSPEDEDGMQHLQDTNAQLMENITGYYDFAAMSKSVNGARKRLDRASFTANVEVRASAKKGNGLFANKEIKAGEIVLVERALAAAFESEAASGMRIILNVNTNTGRTGAHALLFYQVVQKMLHNPI